MNKMDLDQIINKLRNNYDRNKNYYEFLFSVLYFTDENFKEVNFLRSYSSNKQKRFGLKKPLIVEEEYKSKNKINHNSIISVFKSIFGNDFIKSKPSKFLDVFISCCGDKTIVNVSSNVKSILLKKLLTDFDTCELYKKYNYRKRKGFTKKILRSFFEDGNEIEDNPLFIYFLCDYFKMNICVVIPDKEKNDIIFYSSCNKFSIYKSTIIVEKCGGDMYQYYIMSNGESIFTSDSSFIYKLLLYKIQKDFVNRLNAIANNLSTNRKIFHKVIENKVIENEVIENEVIENEIIENEVIENEVIENEVIENEVIENEVIENEVNKSKDKNIEYNPKKLIKMKLLILQNISEGFGINIKKSKKSGNGLKNKTKSELVSDIMNHLS